MKDEMDGDGTTKQLWIGYMDDAWQRSDQIMQDGAGAGAGGELLRSMHLSSITAACSAVSAVVVWAWYASHVDRYTRLASCFRFGGVGMWPGRGSQQNPRLHGLRVQNKGLLSSCLPASWSGAYPWSIIIMHSSVKTKLK